MHDTSGEKPDIQCLADVASEYAGYFTNADAESCGFSRALLAHHENTGRFVRVRRGVYRFRETPVSPREEVISAWLGVGRDVAVVSHETALDLHDLSDVIPSRVHLTLPRSRRYVRAPRGATLHTTTRALTQADVTVREGIRLTEPTQTIFDAAEAGVGPEQIELAVRQALDRGLTTTTLLREKAHGRSSRVRALIDRAIHLAGRP
jgi:predicted transcriptional regulator of viral defense system